MEQTLLDAAELARLLGVRPATVRKWAREGRVPEIRLSAKVRRFDYADVMGALRGQELTSSDSVGTRRKQIQGRP